jgi:antitoxin (DNA-binding transcriptional repressor) of toxin-antitoxin stability system
MKTTSVSNLKTHLSRYIEMVTQGTEVQILDRGVPVARLVGPGDALAGEQSAWLQRLARRGLIKAGTGSATWLLERQPIQADAGLAEALDEEREDRA